MESNKEHSVLLAGSKQKCIVKGCSNFGNPQNNCMCNGCLAYIQGVFSQRGITLQGGKGTCVNVKCPLNASSPGFLCDQCTAIFVSREPKLFTKVSEQICKTDQCSNFGNPQKADMCNDCWEKKFFPCRTPGCQHFSVAKNDYLCNQCSRSMNKASLKISKEAIPTPFVCSTPDCSRPGEEKFDYKCESCYKANNNNICATVGCTAPAYSDMQGFCLLCYTGPSGDRLPDTQPLQEMISKAISNPVKGAQLFNAPPITTEQRDDFGSDWTPCQSEGCGNATLAGSFCSECKLKNKDKVVKCLVSGCSGISVHKGFCKSCFDLGSEPKRCSTPGCSHYGLPDKLGKCNICFVADTTTKCKTPGCDFYGHAKTDGLCSGCYKMCLVVDQESFRGNSKRRHGSGPPKRINPLCADLTSPLNSQDNVDRVALQDGKHLPVFTPTQNTSGKFYPPGIVVHSPGGSQISSRTELNTAEGITKQQSYQLAESSPVDAPVSGMASVFSEVSQYPGGDATTQADSSHQKQHQITSRYDMKRSFSSPLDALTLMATKCRNRSCNRMSVQGTHPFCLTCYENTKLQPRPVQMSLAEQENRLRSESNPALDTVGDVLCEVENCGNPVSSHYYPLCDNCARSQENVHSKAQPGIPNCPDGSLSQAQKMKSGEICSSRPKKRVSLKPMTMDPCTLPCDVLICLWNNSNIIKGKHTLLDTAKILIEDINTFRTDLQLEEVCETKAGNSQAKVVLHCKYDSAWDRPIANALLKCITVAEGKRFTRVALPVLQCDDLAKDPEMATRISMFVISQIQSMKNSKQYIERLYMCVGTTEILKRCKEEFVRITASRQKRAKPTPTCKQCNEKPSVKVKPLSGSCEDKCSLFCIRCLKQGREKGLTCPHHGSCLAPVGHEHSYALLIAGFDIKEKAARIFIRDTEMMHRALQDPQYIGLKEDKIWLIKARHPGIPEDLRTQVFNAFRELGRKLEKCQNKDHAILYLYYSGHNDKKVLKLGGEQYTMTPSELKEKMFELGIGDIVVILDCCYSGGVNLAETVNDEDFTTSLGNCSKSDSEPLIYLPKLWNLEDLETDGGAKGRLTRVYQWSSSIAEEESYFGSVQSFFTLCIVQAMKGNCPIKSGECAVCSEFLESCRRDGAIFLNAIHTSVEYHVPLLAEKLKPRREQHPQLDTHEDDLLFAFPPWQE